MQAKKVPSQKVDRNSEIRIRGVAPHIKKELEAIRVLLKKPFESQAMEFLVMDYRATRSLVQQLQARNNDLHKRMAALVAREDKVQAILDAMLAAHTQYNERTVKVIKETLKKFKGTVKRSSARSAAAGQVKSVPQKKGGRK